MPGAPAQNFIPIKEIRDGIVILKDGSMRSVLAVSATNLGLKSAEEQQAVIVQFQNFLNSLDFSVQMTVQSRRLDMRPYLQTLKDQLALQTEELLRIQTQMYITYIQTFADQMDVMKKFFYVIVPYSPTFADASKGSSGPLGGILSMFGMGGSSKSDAQTATFMESRLQLSQRIAVVQQGLGGLGLKAEPLSTEQSIELFYNLYNPGDSQAGLTKALS